MTPKQLKSRQKYIKASPMKKISSMSKFSRREPNKIKENREVHPNDVFDSFFDFEEDIYGKDLEVIPLSQLRQEKKFSGMEELQNQIKKDLESARNYLSEHGLLPVE